MPDYFFNFQLAMDEQQVVIAFDTQALGQLAYEYGSKMPFGHLHSQFQKQWKKPNPRCVATKTQYSYRFWTAKLGNRRT